MTLRCAPETTSGGGTGDDFDDLDDLDDFTVYTWDDFVCGTGDNLDDLDDLDKVFRSLLSHLRSLQPETA